MSHVTIIFLTLLLVLAGSCGIEPVAQKGPWSLKFTTSGGFAGVGTGNISVDSEGKYRYQEPSSPQQVRKGCDSTFKPKELQGLSEAVSQAEHLEPLKLGADGRSADHGIDAGRGASTHENGEFSVMFHRPILSGSHDN